MVFVAFFVPLALYLLVLGYINRLPRPLIVSGTWDFIGVLFAVSGFLMCGGPVLLFSLSERWRMFWLLGEGNTREALENTSRINIFLALLYFLVVVSGCVWIFSRQRYLTCIYNAEPSDVEEAVVESCEQLGLDPIRSGNLFVFGLTLDGLTSPPAHPEGIQAPHYLPASARQATPEKLVEGAGELVGNSAILEVEPFHALKHVTLHWDPHDSPLRPVLEAELDRRLPQAGAADHDGGLWLTLAGFALLAVSVLIVFSLVLRSLAAR